MRTDPAKLLLRASLSTLIGVAACSDESSPAADTEASTGTQEPSSTAAASNSSPEATTAGDESTTGGLDPSEGSATATTTSTSSVEDSTSSSGTDGEDPLAFAGDMHGYRWELPCEDPAQRDTCAWDPALLRGAIQDPNATLHRESVVTFGGDPSVVYDVEIQIRGLSEPKDFSGGEVVGDHFQIGGTPGVNDYNIYGIEVDDPVNAYTLNRNAMGVGHYTFLLDYTVTIQIRGGAEVRLTMIDPNNIAIANPGGNIASGEPFVVPDIEPFPDPFFGQFIQMDVLSVAPAK